MQFSKIARTKRRTPRGEVVALDDFSLGLNSVLPASKLQPGELHAALNWILSKTRGLRTKPGLAALTNTALDYPANFICECNIDGDSYVLAVDTQNELFYLDAENDPTSIGTLEGEATIVNYKGKALVLDTSYIKVWDGSSLSLAYDDGSGSTGYQVDQSSLSREEDLNLGDGNTERVAVAFESQTWDSGYTIPVTRLKVYLKKSGSPTGSAVAKLRKQSDDSVVSTSDTTLDVSSLTTSYDLETFTFPGTGDMDPETSYYASIEYDNGDGSNYICVAAETVASEGTAATHDGTSWSADDTANPCIKVQPGRPPKASFGITYATRLFVVGPDEPGKMKFSNVNTYLDYSTSNGGGYVGVMDDSANNFPVGALAYQFKTLFVFGTEDQPYLAALTGETPSDFAVERVLSQVAATQETTVHTFNNVVFSASWGATSLSGVQEYGDVRASGLTARVADRFQDYWTDAAFAGYDPQHELYLIKLPSQPKVIAVHVGLEMQLEQEIVTPCTELLFARYRLSDPDSYQWTKSSNGDNEYFVTDTDGNDPGLSEPEYLYLNYRQLESGTLGSLSNLEWGFGDNDGNGFDSVYMRQDEGDPDSLDDVIVAPLVPYAFGTWEGKAYLSGDDGHIYYFQPETCRDSGVESLFRLDLPYVMSDFQEFSMERLQTQAYGRLGGSFTLSLYTDQQYVEPDFSHDVDLPVADDITVDDLDTVTVNDADFPISAATTVWPEWFNLICRSFLVSLHSFKTRNKPIYIENITFNVRSLR